jgi:molybdenum cofactor cytidylyltransferase
LSKAIDELLRAGSELVIVFGASAIADRRDVIPAALEDVGGVIEHFGMPVDPGNLMLVGKARGISVIGAPGCARSPKENGFDWVLMRLLAGLPVRREDITGMGVGGLLMEIVTRPQPREKAVPEKGKQVAAVVLAAGRSTRMGAVNKMIAEIGGKPLVRIAAEQALASKALPVIVVTGHERDKVEAALKGLDVRFANNPDYAEGLGTSLRTGIAAVPPEADGAVILLGDMPQIDAKLIDRLVAAFDPEKGALVVVPTIEGRRGNPVIWARRFFPELMAVTGDVGARHIIANVAEAVAEVPVSDPAITVDVDTPDVLARISEAVR